MNFYFVQTLISRRIALHFVTLYFENINFHFPISLTCYVNFPRERYVYNFIHKCACCPHHVTFQECVWNSTYKNIFLNRLLLLRLFVLNRARAMFLEVVRRNTTTNHIVKLFRIAHILHHKLKFQSQTQLDIFSLYIRSENAHKTKILNGNG